MIFHIMTNLKMLVDYRPDNNITQKSDVSLYVHGVLVVLNLNTWKIIGLHEIKRLDDLLEVKLSKIRSIK